MYFVRLRKCWLLDKALPYRISYLDIWLVFSCDCFTLFLVYSYIVQ